MPQIRWGWNQAFQAFLYRPYIEYEPWILNMNFISARHQIYSWTTSSGLTTRRLLRLLCQVRISSRHDHAEPESHKREADKWEVRSRARVCVCLSVCVRVCVFICPSSDISKGNQVMKSVFKWTEISSRRHTLKHVYLLYISSPRLCIILNNSNQKQFVTSFCLWWSRRW